jgi:mevalonate kinase
MPLTTLKAYPSKILLLGEYTVTRGAPALAIPFFGKSGYWKKEDKPCSRLPELIRFFKENGFESILDVEAFEKDVLEGWLFYSEIPSGYGLGSSGALIAAVYEKYAFTTDNNPEKLRLLFSSMENYYHGKSSGIDPLVSYLREAVYMENIDKISKVSLPPFMDVQIFLLDSFQSRNTEFWVEHFRKKIADSTEFSNAVDLLARINQIAIESLLGGDNTLFWENIKKISKLQFEYFREFIPEAHLEIWKDSLENNDMVCKLCGAGGGGYTLGFSKNMSINYHKILTYNPVWVE